MVSSTVIAVLCLVLVLCSNCSAIYDAPPVLTRLGTQLSTSKGVRGEDFTNTRSYIQAAIISNQLNIYFCTAENADTLVWEFSNDEGETYTEITDQSGHVFSPVLLEVISQTAVKRVIFDDLSKRSESMSGYYRCRATNSCNYTAISPTVRLIFPELQSYNLLKQLQNLKANEPAILEPGSATQPPIKPEEFKKYFPEWLSYSWVRRIALIDESESDVAYKQTSIPRSRIHTNGVTGDLVFDNVVTNDKTMFNTSLIDLRGTNEYQCSLQLKGYFEAKIVARYTIEVTSNTASLPNYVSRIIPKRTEAIGTQDTANQLITCIKGSACRIPCTFAGKATIDPTPTIEKQGQVYQNQVIPKPYGVELVDVVSEASGTWKCSNANSNDVALYEVSIEAFPSLTVPLEDAYIPSTTVDYVIQCDGVNSDTSTFLINGKKVTSGDSPDWVQIGGVGGTDLILREPRSANIMCILKNSLGSAYYSMNLAVYEEPKVKSTNNVVASTDNITATSSNEYDFMCSIRLDAKATGPPGSQNVDIYWTSNIQGSKEDTVTTWTKFRQSQAAGNPAVKDVKTNSFKRDGLQEFNTTITVVLDTTSQHILPNTVWRCVAEYRILPNTVNFLAESTNLTFKTTSIPDDPEPQTSFDDWWVIGVIGGLLFFFLLIILIVCCVRQNIGEQYRVDEKEREAGHDPEHEMKAYGFHDYKRPDQNPVKGSRASMNYSDRPMESDAGSMDEYGDIEPGRFNEDGSFIGQYTSQNPRYQADV